jgi:hypothetical protein
MVAVIHHADLGEWEVDSEVVALEEDGWGWEWEEALSEGLCPCWRVGDVWVEWAAWVEWVGWVGWVEWVVVWAWAANKR